MSRAPTSVTFDGARRILRVELKRSPTPPVVAVHAGRLTINGEPVAGDGRSPWVTADDVEATLYGNVLEVSLPGPPVVDHHTARDVPAIARRRPRRPRPYATGNLTS
jgi:hypothetical protein